MRPSALMYHACSKTSPGINVRTSTMRPGSRLAPGHPCPPTVSGALGTPRMPHALENPRFEYWDDWDTFVPVEPVGCRWVSYATSMTLTEPRPSLVLEQEPWVPAGDQQRNRRIGVVFHAEPWCHPALPGIVSLQYAVSMPPLPRKLVTEATFNGRYGEMCRVPGVRREARAFVLGPVHNYCLEYRTVLYFRTRYKTLRANQTYVEAFLRTFVRDTILMNCCFHYLANRCSATPGARVTPGTTVASSATSNAPPPPVKRSIIFATPAKQVAHCSRASLGLGHGPPARAVRGAESRVQPGAVCANVAGPAVRRVEGHVRPLRPPVLQVKHSRACFPCTDLVGSITRSQTSRTLQRLIIFVVPSGGGVARFEKRNFRSRVHTAGFLCEMFSLLFRSKKFRRTLSKATKVRDVSPPT